jgi:multiple sugar transport system permease protein
MSALKRYATNTFFLTPHLAIFLVFFVVPICFGIYASFTKWDIFGEPVWVGLRNYQTLFTNPESTFYRQFWNGFGNTFKFVLIMVPFQILVPLVLALAINARPFMARFFQGVFYIPTLFSISAVILTWLFILHPSYGLLNKALGIHINWFGEQPFAWVSIVAVTTWWIIGINMIIYVTALANIDTSILESAKIDGVGGIRKILAIDIPLIRFPLMFTVLAAATSQFNIYGQPLLLTRGGPEQSTYVLIMYIQDSAFGSGKPIAGMASAMATLLGLFIGVFSVLQMRPLLRQEKEN